MITLLGIHCLDEPWSLKMVKILDFTDDLTLWFYLDTVQGPSTLDPIAFTYTMHIGSLTILWRIEFLS